MGRQRERRQTADDGRRKFRRMKFDEPCRFPRSAFCGLISFSLSLVFCLLTFCNAHADETVLATAMSEDARIRLRMTAEPANPRLSDTVVLTLTVDAYRQIQTDWPEFGDALGDLKILGLNEEPAKIEGDREIRQLKLKIVPTKGGTAPIWPMTIRYYEHDPSSQTLSVTLPASQITIGANVTPETASLNMEQTPYTLLASMSKMIFWIFGIVAVVFLGALVFFLLLRKKTPMTVPEKTLSPREKALLRLQVLLDSNQLEYEVKGFFIELSDIVRWYVEQVTDIRAPEQTTEEFLQEISCRGNLLSEQIQNRLRQFLTASDMVKFAKFKPQREEIAVTIRYAEEFIKTL